ncbi:hypothetical protein JX265_012964 [Neoarthrinium moseri]|uniref:Uncharacterized protein n=1 Tax=Neoarthrinium moseri TaxID=1658444 RepID=A0A9Q0AGC7_9PEZI|nr:uncharacterized protein JN550_002875 [Neoarthrinium moseri]KAI1840751.1 hypothetical protein JX266_013025 [Neoarthrinium moseri]KAI1852936.1 hypothetical protein JX265_012964 [Neoarthrinium moseri]KAI1874296.1 hypothetical protein JN550_002875 [Neoarthrinium moseri]
MVPQLRYVFTLDVELAPPVDFGKTYSGDRRFIPITGGTLDGDGIQGRILPGGGDWNAAREDGVVHVMAKYAIQMDDGTMVNITNEGYGRASQQTMKTVFSSPEAVAGSPTNGASEWYTKTFPHFEVAEGKYGWLGKSCFVGDLLPPERLGRVKIRIYEIV